MLNSCTTPSCQRVLNQDNEKRELPTTKYETCQLAPITPKGVKTPSAKNAQNLSTRTNLQ